MNPVKTTTDILTYLRIEGFILSPLNKERIDRIVRDALKEAHNKGVKEALPGCTCGQPSCQCR